MDQNVVDELRTLYEHISVKYTVFTKFEEIWVDKIKMQDWYPLNKDSAFKLKNMAWLLFVIAKSIVTHFHLF